MEQDVFSHPEVQAAIQADYVAVRLNVDHNAVIAQQYGVSSLPTDVVVLPDGRLLERQPGFMDRHQYVARLRQIAMDARRPPAVVSGVQPAGSLPMMAGSAPMMGGAPVAGNPVYGSPPPCVIPGQSAAQGPPAGSADPPLGSPPPVQAMAPGGGEMVASSPPDLALAVNQPPTGPGPSIGQAAPQQPPIQPPANWQAPQDNPTGQLMGDLSAQPSSPGFSPTAETAPTDPPGQPASPAGPSACPFALDGFCPVELVENKTWKLGDVRWGANHRGRTYLFSGPEQQQRFLQDPDRYSPVASGMDVVLAITREQVVPGRREYGVFCANRVFLFAGEESLAAFSKEPEKYLQQIESLNQSPPQQPPTYR